MPTHKPKKAKSPTGRPSQVHPDLDAAMRGKGGERPAAQGQPAAPESGDYRAKKMDKGLPLHNRKKKSGRMSKKIPKGYDY